MEAVFENRKIEQNDRDKLKVHGEINWANLPPNSEWSAGLKVEDEQGGTYSLTIEKIDGRTIRITNWKEFTNKRKDIKAGDEISLYKKNNYFGSAGIPYLIKMKKA